MTIQASVKYVLILLLCLAFLPFIYVSFFIHPVADDLTYAVKAIHHPFAIAWLNEYLYWNGRISSNVFVLLNPMVWDSLVWYRLIPILLIALTLLSVFVAVRFVFRHVFVWSTQLLIALAFSLLLLHQLPLISEGIYWYTSAVTYQLGIIFFILTAIAVYALFKKNYLFSAFAHRAITCLLLLVSAGFNEVQMLLTIFFSAVILFYAYRNKRFKNESVLIFSTSLIAVFLVIMAPGNDIRAGIYTEVHRFWYSAGMSLLQTGRFFLMWASSFALLFSSLLFFYIYINNKPLQRFIQPLSFIHPLVAVGILFSVLFIAVFPAYWSTGILGQHRTLNLACFYFHVLWFFTLAIGLNAYLPLSKVKPLSAQYTLMLVLVFFINLIAVKNNGLVLHDIMSKKVHTFDKQMQQRRQSILTAIHNKNESISLASISSKPASIFVYDISSNPDHWLNLAYNRYYNTEQPIRVK